MSAVFEEMSEAPKSQKASMLPSYLQSSLFKPTKRGLGEMDKAPVSRNKWFGKNSTESRIKGVPAQVRDIQSSLRNRVPTPTVTEDTRSRAHEFSNRGTLQRQNTAPTNVENPFRRKFSLDSQLPTSEDTSTLKSQESGNSFNRPTPVKPINLRSMQDNPFSPQSSRYSLDKNSNSLSHRSSLDGPSTPSPRIRRSMDQNPSVRSRGSLDVTPPPRMSLDGNRNIPTSPGSRGSSLDGCPSTPSRKSQGGLSRNTSAPLAPSRLSLDTNHHGGNNRSRSSLDDSSSPPSGPSTPSTPSNPSRKSLDSNQPSTHPRGSMESVRKSGHLGPGQAAKRVHRSATCHLDVGHVSVAREQGYAPTPKTRYSPNLNPASPKTKLQIQLKKIQQFTMAKRDDESSSSDSEEEDLFSIPKTAKTSHGTPSGAAQQNNDWFNEVEKSAAGGSKSACSSPSAAVPKAGGGRFQHFAKRVAKTNGIVHHMLNKKPGLAQRSAMDMSVGIKAHLARKYSLDARGRHGAKGGVPEDESSLTATELKKLKEKEEMSKDVWRFKAYYDDLALRCDNGYGTVTMDLLEAEVFRNNPDVVKMALPTLRKSVQDPLNIPFENFLLMYYPDTPTYELKRMLKGTMPKKVVEAPQLEVPSDELLYDLNELWETWDLDGNGELDSYEFRQAMKSLGITDDDHFQQIFKEIDTSKNESIDKAEFMAWYIWNDAAEKDQFVPMTEIMDSCVNALN